MRLVPICLGLVLLALPTRAGEPELRPPQASLDIEIGPRDRPGRARIYWLCYGGDLGAAARGWLRERAARPDCAGSAALIDSTSPALARALEAAAGGRVLGDARRGEVRTLDPEPGHVVRLDARFCYSDRDVEQVIDWTRRQLAALCSREPQAPETSPASPIPEGR